MANVTQIFTNQTANGTSLEFSTGGGMPFVKVSGVFDGATIQLEAKTNHTNDDFSSTGIDEQFTESSAFIPAYKQTVVYRLRVSGVDTSTSINAFVID